MRAYTQLTQEQRYQIHAFMKTGFTQKDIALEIRAQSSTVSRELRRNRSLCGYRPQQAHEKTMTRRRNKAQPRRVASTWDLVETLIRRDWSPEQISGRLRAERGIAISHEWIYLHIYQNNRGASIFHCPSVKKH